MIPIGDARRRFGFPWMTSLLLLLSLAFFLFEHIAPLQSDALVAQYAFQPPSVPRFNNLAPLWRALVCLLIQGRSWLEPIVNLIFLWVLGRKIEDACGPWGLLLLYLFSGVGGVVSALMLHQLIPEGTTPAVFGLAGVVAGLFGAYLILYRMAPIRTWIPPLIFARVPAFMHLLYWAGLEFVNVDFGKLQAGQLTEVVSPETEAVKWTVVGAFLVGLLAAHIFARREFLFYRIIQARTSAR